VAPITLSSHSLHAQASTILPAQMVFQVEFSAVVFELQPARKAVGGQLLELHKAEAKQETASPPLLNSAIRNSAPFVGTPRAFRWLSGSTHG